MDLNRKTQYNRRKRGYITLISILIVAAVGTAIAVSLILTGLGASRTSLVVQQSVQARALAAACTESALQEIRKITQFSGTGTTTTSEGICTYRVIALAGQNRTIDATSTVGSILQKIRVSVTAINPKITVSSWQEVQ